MPDQQDGFTTVPSCRLYAILARSAAIGVIFRRGPTKWVQIIKWDTNTDTFEAGQWFHGRIYEGRCDLAPDGSLLIYSANKFTGNVLRDREQTYNYWTAISKPPYFTALALWPAPAAGYGGGLFVNASEVWLNQAPEYAQPHPDHRPPAWLNVRAYADSSADWFEEGVETDRRLRDGWLRVQQGSYSSTRRKYVTEKAEIWERLSHDGSHVLVHERLSVHLGRNDTVRYGLRLRDGTPVPVPGAEWTDWDHRGRLVFSREAKLFSAELVNGKLQEDLLADFGANKPQDMAAPEWAQTW